MAESFARDRLTLRAHHLLCLHGFRGMGYSDGFVENMAAVRDRLRAPQAPEIVVTDAPDDICASCPHQTAHTCDKEIEDALIHATELDRRVLEWLGISTGQRFLRDELLALLLAKITPEDVAIICNGCQWQPFEYCSEGLRDRSLEV